jgi:hypothetical protein
MSDEGCEKYRIIFGIYLIGRKKREKIYFKNNFIKKSLKFFVNKKL